MYRNAMGMRVSVVAGNTGLLALLLLIVVMLATKAQARNPGISITHKVGEADPLSAESSTEANITLGIQVRKAGSQQPMLLLRGSRTSADNSAPFRVSTNISRLPCSGKYEFEAAQENTGNGNTETYEALIRLSGPAARPTSPCGRSLPPGPGDLHVSLGIADNEFFDLDGSRAKADPFKGALIFVNLPECGTGYWLDADFSLVGRQRSFDFKVQVLEVKASIQGHRFPPERC